MIARASAQTTFAPFYDRNGAAASLRSEPVQRIAAIPSPQPTDSDLQEDRVTLSPTGLDRSRRTVDQTADGNVPAGEETAATTQPAQTDKGNSGQALTEADLKIVRELKQRDREVKSHEQAHLATAGQYARGGASYTYQQGPDGRRYAVGGEVPIDVGKEKTPEETIQKMRTVRSAALAPASPSPADRSIAATASANEAQARQEMQAAQAEERAEQRQQASTDARRPDQATTEGVASGQGLRRRAPLDVIA